MIASEARVILPRSHHPRSHRPRSHSSPVRCLRHLSHPPPESAPGHPFFASEDPSSRRSRTAGTPAHHTVSSRIFRQCRLPEQAFVLPVMGIRPRRRDASPPPRAKACGEALHCESAAKRTQRSSAHRFMLTYRQDPPAIGTVLASGRYMIFGMTGRESMRIPHISARRMCVGK